MPGGAVRRRRRGAVDVGVQLHRLGHQEGPLLPGRHPRVHVRPAERDDARAQRLHDAEPGRLPVLQPQGGQAGGRRDGGRRRGLRVRPQEAQDALLRLRRAPRPPLHRRPDEVHRQAQELPLPRLTDRPPPRRPAGHPWRPQPSLPSSACRLLLPILSEIICYTCCL